MILLPDLKKVLTSIFILLIGMAAITLIAGVGLYYFGFRVKETPTCMNFSALVTSNMVQKFEQDLENDIGVNLPSKITRGSAWVWKSDRVSVSYYPNRNGIDYSIFVCSNRRDSEMWKTTSLQVEKLLQRDSLSFNAWLQLNSNDFECGLNCSMDVELPLNFESLAQRELAPKRRRW